MKLKRLVYFSMIAKAQAEDYLEQSENSARTVFLTKQFFNDFKWENDVIQSDAC